MEQFIKHCMVLSCTSSTVLFQVFMNLKMWTATAYTHQNRNRVFTSLNGVWKYPCSFLLPKGVSCTWKLMKTVWGYKGSERRGALPMIATNKHGQSLHNCSTQYIYTTEENRNCDINLTLVTSKKNKTVSNQTCIFAMFWATRSYCWLLILLMHMCNIN